MNAGQVRVGYIHFAFLGDESVWAAQASECANDQGQFWEYHDALFDNQRGENQGAFSQANLKQLAAQLKLDTAAFNACLDSGQHQDVVQADIAFAQSLGVRSTPTFVINGKPLVGGQPFEVFQQYLTAELP